MDDNQKIKLNAIKSFLRRMSLNNNRRWGRLGEEFARLHSRKEKIPSITGTSAYRIPDILTDTELIEVKNVKYQRLTNQIKDFLLFCSMTSRHFTLYLRDDARVSSDILKLKESGKLEIQHLGHWTTRIGQEKFFKAIEPIVVKALNMATSDSK